MDFHSLTRKELQTLCKNNKIPANMTNVAMADALKALNIVEGLDELLNQSQSPEKTTKNLSQEIPSTVTWTFTRRKTTKEEPQSTQPTTRTRRITRKTIEFDEENKNVNVPETLAVVTTTRRRAQKPEPDVAEQKKGDLPETPALRSGRTRAGVRSTMRKVEAGKEEETLQRGNGARRSVRLLEKCMAGLSLKESGKMEPVKNDQSGTSLEVPLARNLSASLEDEKDLKDVGTMISESGSYQCDKTKDPKGSDDDVVTEDLSDTDSINEELIAVEAVETKPDVVTEAVDEVLEEVINHENDDADELPKDEDFAEDKVSQDVQVLPDSENLVNEKSEDGLDQLVDSDIDEDSGSDNNSLADELPEELPCETASYCSENLMADMVNEEALVDVNVSEVVFDVAETSLPKATQSVVGEKLTDKTPDYADAEALFDVSVKPAEEFAETTLQESPPQEKSPTTAAKQTSPSPYLVSDIAATNSIPLSPILTTQIFSPARLTPMKSSSKKQTTIPKMTPFSDNKENIENNNVKEVELGLAKMKKNKNVIDEQTLQNLDNMSLRYLKKLTRKLNNLQISDDVVNKEDNNGTEQSYVKIRPALQMLPQNCMNAREIEKKN